MAGFQTIFEIQQNMTVNNRRVVGQQVARSGYITVAQYLTAVPWVFTVQPHEYLYYPQVRDIIQSIDNADRQNPETIIFNSANLSWFTKMQGTATGATLAATPAPNSQTLSLTSNGTYKAGDFIMINGYTYKVTADSAGSTVYPPSYHWRTYIRDNCLFGQCLYVYCCRRGLPHIYFEPNERWCFCSMGPTVCV